MNETTLYFLHDDGSVSKSVSNVEPEQIERPGNAVEITAEEHAERLEVILAGNAAVVAELVGVEQQQKKGDYEALVALGAPQDTARRLSGHVMEGV